MSLLLITHIWRVVATCHRRAWLFHRGRRRTQRCHEIVLEVLVSDYRILSIFFVVAALSLRELVILRGRNPSERVSAQGSLTPRMERKSLNGTDALSTNDEPDDLWTTKSRREHKSRLFLILMKALSSQAYVRG
jgi:hypothetical protein